MRTDGRPGEPSSRRPARAGGACCLLLLGLALLPALFGAWWLTRPVATGAGKLTRLEVARTYVKLARRMPGYCQQGYIVGIVGGVGSSLAIAADKAHDVPWIVTPPDLRGEIAWSAVPGEALRLLEKSLDDLFHGSGHECALPRPADWSVGPVGRSAHLAQDTMARALVLRWTIARLAPRHP
jgi:hypothetical protein